MSYLTPEQVEHLLQPINTSRVLNLRGMSYLAQQDVRAHMNRIFGFAGWSTDVLETVLLFESQNERSYWVVGYRATVKVTIYNSDLEEMAHYTDSHAAENAPQPSRGEAHALALTTAVSTAFKRACTNLGDQFGLSLYNKGQTSAFVKGTLVGSPVASAPAVEVISTGDEVGELQDPAGIEEPAPAPILADRSEETHRALGALLLLADIADPHERVAKVLAWKKHANDRGILGETTLHEGHTVTLARLADTISTGQLVP